MVDQLNDLINKLSDDLKAQKPMQHPALRLLPWVALVFIYVAGFVVLSGVRFDWAHKLHDAIFVYEITAAGFIAITSALAAVWLCVPDVRGQYWIVAVPITLGLNFVHWTIVEGYSLGFVFPPFNIQHCMFDGIELFFVPALALTIITSRGATTHPYLMALMNGMAACSVSYIGMRFTCPMDAIGHMFVYHILPLVLLGTVIGLLARKIFKW